MTAALKENPIKKIEYINFLAASGKTRAEIATELGYKDERSLYVFMKRRGLEWNTKKGLYVVKGEKDEAEETVEDIPTGKVASVISLFDKKMDGKDIARKLRFGSFQEMADYMRSKGYIWDSQKGNYKRAEIVVEAECVKVEQPQQSAQTQARDNAFIEEYGDVLKLLKANKDKLTEMLKVNESDDLPRYSVSGFNVTKSIDIPSPLVRLVKDFGEEKNLSQREIVKVALIDFLKKYGYSDEVKTLLHV